MRIPRPSRLPRRAAALAAAAALTLLGCAGTAAAVAGPQAGAPAEGPCKTRTGGVYFTPFGHADVTLKPQALKVLAKEKATWAVSAPLSKVPGRDDLARFPLGFFEDSIEPDLAHVFRVCYPGGLTLARPATKDKAVCDGIWLAVLPVPGAYCNLRVNDGPERRTLLATTTAKDLLVGSHSFHPVITPRVDPGTGELGFGPKDWEFRAARPFSDALATFGVDLPEGTPIFNLDATLSFLPGPDFWASLSGKTVYGDPLKSARTQG
ncbi:hypothetical protein ABT160_42920 [Streptomyces sp. NPDC001941]|uniref:hypothetical protein n=1 Tax=Streptomyces sp. NPDC001941 TaxID=3154659 RepID=UPI00331E8D1D